MYLIIKDKYKLIHHDLSIIDNLTYRGISIYDTANGFYISLKEHYHFDDNSKTKKLELKEYVVINDFDFSKIHIYVYENRSGVDDYRLYELRNFIVSLSEKADIISNDKYFHDKYLILKDGYLKGNLNPSVNGFKYDQQKLSPGDIVECIGFKFIYYDEYLYLNRFNNTIRLKEYEVKEHFIRYQTPELSPGFHIPELIEELTFDELKEFESIKKSSIQNFVRTILPNIVMAVSMSLMAYINYYNSLFNSLSNTSTIQYFIMPAGIIITGTIIPCAFFLFERYQTYKKYDRNKKEYLDYLDEYENDLEERINKYINGLNSSFFNIDDSKQKMFSIGNKSRDFLMLSLGKKQIAKELSFNKTEDQHINEKIDSIRKRLLHIDDYPLFLDIKEHRIITVVARNKLKRYFFNSFLLELSYKHHYNDLALAIYTNDLNNINNYYNLPHLFVSEKRLTLNTVKQIQELDQMKLNKPLVLFMYDRCDYTFTNSNIHLIYFTDISNDLYKDSDIIIEYHNNLSYIYGHNYKQQFIFIQNELDFAKHFYLLGKLNRSFNDSQFRSFKDLFSFDMIKQMYVNHDRFLKADFAYTKNELLAFDLHESKQGPHGLIAGSTGSGKSELIVSLLLSLCIKYPPDYLNIILIDYKGGGIKESLSYQNEAIPHIIASISNIENNQFERLIIALNNECIRRQKMFKELSLKSNTSIMNIDDYYDNAESKQSMSHLLIVIDEFAELKKEEPELIKELISISRIGRSLGLHLILATQKPSGNIDEEIWSNSRFKLSLKAFEEKDSLDVIRNKDAAYLNEAGSFILKVDEGLVKGKSIYSKNDINGNDQLEVSVLDNTLEKIKTIKERRNMVFTEASAFSERIIETSNKLNIIPSSLDFVAPYPCHRKQLAKGACIVFGEIDDYINNKRGLLACGLSENILLYSGRSKEINSILNTLSENRRQTIVLASKHYSNAYISDSITYDNKDDIEYLLNELLNGNHKITVVIEDVQAFLSYDDSYLDTLCKLIKRSKDRQYNFICICSNSQISYRLLNLFSNKIMIQVSDISDVSYFYSMRSRYKGHNFFFKEEPITFVSIIQEELSKNDPVVEPFVKHIPEQIEAKIIESKYLIGYKCDTRDAIMAEERILISSFDEKLLKPYKEAYKDFCEITLYNNSLSKKNYSQILWLGPGIYTQRLFMPETKNDINNSLGVYICNGEQILIRSLKHA